MPTIDDFIRPKEWVSDFVSDLGKVLRRWGNERYIPVRQQIDEDWKEHRLVKPFLKEVLVDLGINSAFFPAESGGTEMPDPVTLTTVICEELARIDSGFATACICSVWGLVPILLAPHRNMELCNEFGPKFCGEDLYMGCHAMTEPASGADLENFGRMHGKTIQTTATPDGDEWIINGHKIWPSNSGDTADLFVTICTTKKGSTDPNDFALILVPADAPGVSVGNPYLKCGMSADMNSDIWFDHVRLPKRYRLHGPGDDLKYWKRTISLGNVASAAMCIGVMKNVYEIIKKWTSERIIAGKPLKEHGICAEMLSELAMLIESTSAWMWQYAREMDHPEIYGWDPWDERFVLKTRGLALHANIAVERACSRAMDFMGSYGYAREFDIEKHWRDQKVIGLWMGGRGLKILENARYWYDLETL
ncbi:MAG: acyl-CoA dehydrogenase family protein [Desulfomonilaceae bacterium]